MQFLLLQAQFQEMKTTHRQLRKNRGLDFQGFLKIIAAQMQNQSLSSSSTDTSQYVMQLTLFSAIQAMNTMTEQSAQQYASSLIGKNVVVSELNKTTGKREPVEGKVDSVTFDVSTNTAYLNIGNKRYNVSDVTGVLGTGQAVPDSNSGKQKTS